MGDTYSHGHDESVLRSHRWRTAANSCGYLLGSLRPGLDLLDVGCGPGNLTAELAALVAPGRVLGIDVAADVVAAARAQPAAAALEHLAFDVGDAYALEADDASFDVVHAHQVLQHLTDPVAALVELRRVLRGDGLLAVRDGDYGAFVWWPADPLLDRWLELYHQLTEANGAEADAGRRIASWVAAAGYRDLLVTSSTWTFADAEARLFWGGLWAERVERSAYAEQTVAYGLSSADELAAIAAAWRRWAESPGACFVTPHVEVLARR